MMREIFLTILCLSLLAVCADAQDSVPPAKKTNRRPAAAAKPIGEPFDNATIKKMAESCVRLETDNGIVELEMFPESATETVRNFLNLVAIKFYDTTLFSRVVPNFVVQGGSFSTRVEKTDKLYERSQRKLQDEPNLIKHERGIISMARGEEKNSASTHFFILVGSAKHLDGTFAAFGRVVKGMEVVEAINKLPVFEEKPARPVRLNKASIIACPVKAENQ